MFQLTILTLMGGRDGGGGDGVDGGRAGEAVGAGERWPWPKAE